MPAKIEKKMKQMGSKSGGFDSRETAKEFADWLVANSERLSFGKPTGDYDIDGL